MEFRIRKVLREQTCIHFASRENSLQWGGVHLWARDIWPAYRHFWRMLHFMRYKYGGWGFRLSSLASSFCVNFFQLSSPARFILISGVPAWKPNQTGRQRDCQKEDYSLIRTAWQADLREKLWNVRHNKSSRHMSLPLGASPRVARDYRQFGQSPLSQPFQGGSAAAMAQAGKNLLTFIVGNLKHFCFRTVCFPGLAVYAAFDVFIFRLFLERTDS